MGQIKNSPAKNVSLQGLIPWIEYLEDTLEDIMRDFYLQNREFVDIRDRLPKQEREIADLEFSRQNLNRIVSWKEDKIDKLREENARLKARLDCQQQDGEEILSESKEHDKLVKLFRSLSTPEQWDKIKNASLGACPECEYNEDMMTDILEERLDEIACWNCNQNPFHKDYSLEKWEEARDDA